MKRKPSHDWWPSPEPKSQDEKPHFESEYWPLPHWIHPLPRHRQPSDPFKAMVEALAMYQAHEEDKYWHMMASWERIERYGRATNQIDNSIKIHAQQNCMSDGNEWGTLSKDDKDSYLSESRDYHLREWMKKNDRPVGQL